MDALAIEMIAIGYSVKIGKCAPWYFWVMSNNKHPKFLVSWYDDILRVQERIDSIFYGCKTTTYIVRFEVNPADPDTITRFFKFF